MSEKIALLNSFKLLACYYFQLHVVTWEEPQELSL